MIPQNIGINFNSPLPFRETMTAVIREIRANTQFSLAIFTPEPARESPINMITGPMTIGGNSFLIKSVPRNFTNRLISP